MGNFVFVQGRLNQLDKLRSVAAAYPRITPQKFTRYQLHLIRYAGLAANWILCWR
jgi:hypothetical protein